MGDRICAGCPAAQTAFRHHRAFIVVACTLSVKLCAILDSTSEPHFAANTMFLRLLSELKTVGGPANRVPSGEALLEF